MKGQRLKRSEARQILHDVAKVVDDLGVGAVTVESVLDKLEPHDGWAQEAELPKKLGVRVERFSTLDAEVQIIAVDESQTWRYLTRDEAHLLVDDYNRRAGAREVPAAPAEVLPTIGLQEIIWDDGRCRGLYPKPERSSSSLFAGDRTFTAGEAAEIVRRCNSWPELRKLWEAFRDGHSHPYAKVRDRITAILSGVLS